MPSLSSKLRWSSVAVVLAAVGLFMMQPVTFGQKKEAEAAKPQMVWSDVSSNSNMKVLRTRVPSGWFVSIGDGRDTRSTFYYYDPEHVWDGTSQPR